MSTETLVWLVPALIAALSGIILWVRSSSRDTGVIQTMAENQRAATGRLFERLKELEEAQEWLSGELGDIRETLIAQGLLPPRTNPGMKVPRERP